MSGKSGTKEAKTEPKLSLIEIARMVQHEWRLLLKNFSEMKSLTFQIFCAELKAIGFQYVFIIHPTLGENVKFLEKCAPLIKHFFFANETQEFRIGVIYMMYVFYFKQPAKQYVKFRITYAEFDFMLNFINNLPETYNQAKLSFWKLVAENAFHFVINERIENMFKRPQTIACPSKDTAPDAKKRFEAQRCLDLITNENGVLPAIRLMEESVNEMRSHFGLPATRHLELFERKIEQLTDVVGNYQNNADVQQISESDESLDGEDIATINDWANHRSQLKRKAFQYDAKTEESSSHTIDFEITTLQNNDSEHEADEPCQTNNQSSKRRKQSTMSDDTSQQLELALDLKNILMESDDDD